MSLGALQGFLMVYHPFEDMTGTSPISIVEPNIPNQKLMKTFRPTCECCNISVEWLWEKVLCWASYVPSEVECPDTFSWGEAYNWASCPVENIGMMMKSITPPERVCFVLASSLRWLKPQLLAKQKLICHGHPMVLTPSERVTLNIINKAPTTFANG